MPPERYRITLKGLPPASRLELVDPVRGTTTKLKAGGPVVQPELELVDYPRLLVIEW